MSCKTEMFATVSNVKHPIYRIATEFSTGECWPAAADMPYCSALPHFVLVRVETGNDSDMVSVTVIATVLLAVVF